VSTQKRPIARDLFYALAGNSTRHVITALGPVVRDANDDLKVLAAKHLATLPASESVDVLIAALEAEEARKNPDPESLVVRTIVWSLATLTGQEFGANSVNWKGWWSKNREKGLSGVVRKKSDS